MKKIPLLIATILLMMMVSGCTIPFVTNPTASPMPSEQPTAIPTQAPTTTPITGASFAGTWDTDYGNMVLTVNGNNVNGTYDYHEGIINGTVTGNKLTGTWTQAPARAPPDDAGDFIFTLSADGSKFDGIWRFGHNDSPSASWDGFWYGNRIS